MFRISVTVVRGFGKLQALPCYGSKLSTVRRMYSVTTVQESTHPDVVIPELPLAKFMLEKIEKYGNKVALIDNTSNKTLTFHEVCEQTKKCSAALYKAGLGKGSVVGLCTANCVEYSIVQLAVAACGAITTTCNPLYTEDEILQQFKLSQTSVVFADASSLSKIENISKHLPSLQKVYVVGNHTGNNSYNDLINSSDEADNHVVEIPIDSKEDVAIMPYSSGTTGLPKGVMLTHHNIIAVSILVPMSQRLLPTSTYYSILPMFHMYGIAFSLGCLMRGVTNVVEEKFSIERLLETVQRHKITHFSAVPPMLLAMDQTDLFDKYDTSSLQRILCGAAPMAISTLKSVQNRYNITLLTGYGMTECLPISLGEPIISPFDSSGSIANNTKVKVIDVETGKELGPNETGEILTDGPHRMKGYFNNPQATAEAIDEEGWMHTGDVGYYDEQGTLYVVDRLKELIKYKAFQVAPAEIESALLRHPKISDVAVLGIPDPEAGELPKAFVVRNDQALTEEEVKKFIEGSVAHYKLLRGGVTFIDTIPKTPSGKILRRELRKLL